MSETDKAHQFVVPAKRITSYPESIHLPILPENVGPMSEEDRTSFIHLFERENAALCGAILRRMQGSTADAVLVQAVIQSSADQILRLLQAFETADAPADAPADPAEEITPKPTQSGIPFAALQFSNRPPSR